MERTDDAARAHGPYAAHVYRAERKRRGRCLVVARTARPVIACCTVTSTEPSSLPRALARPLSIVFAAALTLALGACASAPEAPVDVGVQLAWLDQPAGTLPDSITSISIRVFSGDEDTEGLEAEYTVSNLPDDNGDGRPDRALKGLATGVPIRIALVGLDAARASLYVGRVGPIVLEAGQRRFVDVQMYPVGTSTATPDTTLTGRFLHTATTLPDGRVLIAGGFSSITRLATCPSPFLATDHCFSATGSRDAYLFSPTSGRFFHVVDRLLEARGGHTATLLPGGRVLLAGGATEALVVFSPIGDPTAPRGWMPGVYPQDVMGTATAHATFEIFDPERNAETSDPERNGDDGRGGFVGAADAPTVPGRLNGPRFLQAAAAVPETNLVLLAGGVGGDASGTFEIYDDRRPGGYGVYPNVGAHLRTPRSVPSALGVGTGATAKVWIVGGTFAASNEDLAEIWSQPTATAPNGTLVPATSTGFPASDGASTDPRPEFSTLRPALASVGTGRSHLLSVGWLGALCAEGTTTPVFAGSTGGVEELCANGAPDRSFTTRVSGAGVTQATAVGAPHALGSSAQLDDGSFVVTGGVSNLVMTAQSAIDRYTGNVMADRAVRQTGSTVTLHAQRAFHASAALVGHGVLSTGGVVFTPDTTGAMLVATPVAEVLYLAPL